jgi:SAM-dependent methyltransferase
VAHWNEPDPRRTYDERAASYERGRPSYPPEAIAFLLEGLGAPGEPEVADVAAGTGLLSRLFVQAGCRVTAVEPNASMRAAAPPIPGLRWHEAPAEETALPDAAFHLVTIAQAFHWLEPERALPEMRRILAPRGRLAVLWNDRRKETAFERAYHELLRGLKPPARRASPPADAQRALRGTPWFEEPETRRFAFIHRMDPETLLSRTVSLSYAPREPSALDALEQRLLALHAGHENAEGVVEQGYETIVHVTHARD